MPYIILLSLLLVFTACSDTPDKSSKADTKKTEKNREKTVLIASVKDLQDLFNDINYTAQSWQAGSREIPRIYFSSVGKNWKHVSNTISVAQKKNIFFRLIAPLVLMANEEITKERQKLLNEPLNSAWMIQLAKKYKVLSKDENTLDKAKFQELLKRVDIVPVSLALAQGAEESGWGTSYFASEGNALFGLWDYSGKGMIPKQQRKELGNYGLARYDTPLDSVRGYMYNINVGHAYEKFRSLRAKLRKEGKKISGWELAKTLDKYSERGEAYIKSLHAMMKYNKLQAADDAYLWDKPTIHLKRKE